jgi:hypothetical protein
VSALVGVGVVIRTEEAHDELGVRVVIQLFRRSDLGDPALIDHHNPIRHLQRLLPQPVSTTVMAVAISARTGRTRTSLRMDMMVCLRSRGIVLYLYWIAREYRICRPSIPVSRSEMGV